MRLRRTGMSLIGFAAVVILALLFLGPKPKATAEQPIKFDHEAMVQQGVQCLYCHPDALHSQAAGMPSVQRCMGCHKVIATESPEIKELAGYWERQQPVLWERVYDLPRFTYFSHRMHVTVGGLNCEACHGDVGHMEVAQEAVKMNMGWCLDCHEAQPNAHQLRDCVVCHQ